ncbi:flavin reductase family protein [Gilvimarinus sp. F26214L]|uniref:flavin reductase family protein n=1 Tax=Gilvimarinus sp. DZF01 TaxID=3461371 RepID=UPI0040457649
MTSRQHMGNAMKEGMRHLASGVAVAATRGGDGVPHAMTITSITSVSDEPASLLVCLHRESATCKSLDSTNQFSVSVLRQEQRGIADRCAFTPEDEDRFVVGQWQDYGEQRLPYLPYALATFICRVARKVDYGTHSIVIGEIVDVIVDPEGGQPLVYCRGTYGTFGEV